jgi:hypothetical protein
MRNQRSLATVRVDDGLVDVDAARFLRSGTERTTVPRGTPPEDALHQVLQSSTLLRTGRHLRMRVLIETPRTIFATDPTRSARPAARAVVPDDLLAGLERAIVRRRTRGPASLELGPLARAERAWPDVVRLDPSGVGAIVDRSDAAVTVLLIGASGLLWGRSAPAREPALAVRLLLDRARGQLAVGSEVRWWRLHDVASDEASDVRRARSEFSAAASFELDGTSLRAGATA